MAVTSHLKPSLTIGPAQALGHQAGDHRDETFTEGYVSLWTRADAVIGFDNLTVRSISAGAE
jgi:hypothetical protein